MSKTPLDKSTHKHIIPPPTPTRGDPKIVLAYHVIFTAYGLRLPTDPRSSLATFIRSWQLYYEKHHRPPLTSPPTREEKAQSLTHPPVRFSDPQIQAIATGFRNAISRSKFTLHACAILPDHVHIVLRRHRYNVEQAVNQLKGEATKQLNRQNLHPFPKTFSKSAKQHSPWAEESWDIFLTTAEEIRHAVTYTEQNPTEMNRPPQPWPFLTPYTQ